MKTITSVIPQHRIYFNFSSRHFPIGHLLRINLASVSPNLICTWHIATIASQNMAATVDTSTANQQEGEREKRDMTCLPCCSVTVFLMLFSVPHMILGLPSIIVGVVLYSDAHIWLAHTVSPIWSGVCFFFCGVFGVVSAKRRTPYTIFCFSSFNIISLMVGIIDMQLLRLGLVNHTTDGQTFLKDDYDTMILIALGIAGLESFICAVTALSSCLVGQHVRKAQKSGGQRVVSTEQIIAQRQEQIRQQREHERKVLEKMEKERAKSIRYHRV